MSLISNSNNGNNIIARQELPEDRKMDLSLRPKSLDEFIGQEKLKANLKIFIQAAKQRQEPLEHILFYGSHGLGKTTLSYIIAKEMGVDIQITSGPALEKVGDLAAIITSLREGSILFIDECHRLNRAIEEVLYPAMEEYALDLVVGQGPSAKILRLDLPHFTLIGATTKPSMISPPLRDRFGAVHQLNFYEVSEIKEIIKRSAKILGIKIQEGAAEEIAKRSRFTPRVANRLLKRVRDFTQVKNQIIISQEEAIKAMEMLEIDNLGLNQVDRRLVATIIEKFAGGPVGAKTLAVATGEDLDSIEEIYEPYLIQLGFLNRTPRGRMATDLAYKHLGFKKGML
jgi:Holliday junction DNA helicase RuvB